MFASFESKTTITDDPMKNVYLEEMVNDEPPFLEVKMASNPIVTESVEEMESDEPVENRQHGQNILQCRIDFEMVTSRVHFLSGYARAISHLWLVTHVPLNNFPRIILIKCGSHLKYRTGEWVK